MPCLNKNSLLIWQSDIPPVFPIPLFWQFLSAEEKQKAESFHFARDQLKYTFCRASLRVLLAHYAEISPEKIQFQYTAHGKPYLCGDLSFNLSHTDDRMIVALSSSQEIGIDIEKMRWVSDYLAISENYFSESECQHVMQRSTEHQLAAFFHCWVRKEALLKGIGLGISTGLSAIQQLNCLESTPVFAQQTWNIHTLIGVPPYFAAVAHTGTIERIESVEESWETLFSF